MSQKAGEKLGFIGQNIPSDRRKSLTIIHPEPLYKVDTNEISLAAGGVKETCHFGSFSSQAGWVVVGLGIKSTPDGVRLLSAADWQSVLSKNETNLQKLDGHFVVIRWRPNQIKFFTDSLGLRTIYFAETAEGVAFSTRLDWIARLTGESEIDFETFGCHWLTFNQISYDCLLKRVRRLGPGGFATWTQGSFSLEDKPWTPSTLCDDSTHRSTVEDEGELERYLRNFLKPNLEDRTPSLGLSGGLDSRVLLALFLSPPKDNFSLHLFSHPLDPDVRIAKRIAEENNLAQSHLYEPLPKADEVLRLLTEYIGQTAAVESGSKLLNLRYYSRIHSQSKFVIDGGFGEIWRRQYLNRLRIRGRKALRSGNPNLISRYLFRRRARIFNQDVVRVMEKGIENQISSLWETMPRIEEIGEENFLDLMAIRTRFPNIGCYEQARLDCEVLNYMPFAQPSCLQRLFETPPRWRRNGRLFKRIILKNCPGLAKYPLVKNNTTYPFYFPTTLAWVWTKVKSQLGLSFSNPSVVELLIVLREFIQDIVRSNDVRSYAPYDYPAILRLVSEFYSGRQELAGEVDWWLTFELWRRAIR